MWLLYQDTKRSQALEEVKKNERKRVGWRSLKSLVESVMAIEGSVAKLKNKLGKWDSLQGKREAMEGDGLYHSHDNLVTNLNHKNLDLKKNYFWWRCWQ